AAAAACSDESGLHPGNPPGYFKSVVPENRGQEFGRIIPLEREFRLFVEGADNSEQFGCQGCGGSNYLLDVRSIAHEVSYIICLMKITFLVASLSRFLLRYSGRFARFTGL